MYASGSNYHYYESDDYEDEEGETIVFENGYMKVYFRYNPKGAHLFLINENMTIIT